MLVLGIDIPDGSVHSIRTSCPGETASSFAFPQSQQAGARASSVGSKFVGNLRNGAFIGHERMVIPWINCKPARVIKWKLV